MGILFQGFYLLDNDLWSREKHRNHVQGPRANISATLLEQWPENRSIRKAMFFFLPFVLFALGLHRPEGSAPFKQVLVDLDDSLQTDSE